MLFVFFIELFTECKLYSGIPDTLAELELLKGVDLLFLNGALKTTKGRQRMPVPS